MTENAVLDRAVNPYLRPPSPAALEYATDLCRSELDKPDAMIANLATMTSADVGRLIDRLKAARKARLDAMPAAPEGRYALTTPEGYVRLYRVRSTKATGKPYVVQLVGNGERYIGARGEGARILAVIARDPQEAMARYGRHTGRCGAAGCGRELTDPKSVARGIGPDCLKRLGW